MGTISQMRTGRPPKNPDERKTVGIKIPLTPAEKALIVAAAESDDGKHVTWAREILLNAAKRRLKDNGG